MRRYALLCTVFIAVMVFIYLRLRKDTTLPPGKYIIYTFSGGSEISEFHADTVMFEVGRIVFPQGDSVVILPPGTQMEIYFIPDKH
jgi:hypothetical protein